MPVMPIVSAPPIPASTTSEPEVKVHPKSVDPPLPVSTGTERPTPVLETTAREPESAPPVPVRPIRQFVGNWNGNVRQRGVIPYTVAFSIYDRDRDVVGQIDYPELGCGGKLVLAGVTNKVLQVSEVLTYGLNKCIVGGLITIEMSNAQTSSFNWSNGNPIYEVSAMVSRH